jgi:hypothetical protein
MLLAPTQGVCMTSKAEVRDLRPCPGGPRNRIRCLAFVLAVLGAALAPQWTAAQAGAAAPKTPQHVWLDADGEPLPFQSDAEILEFLQTAPVVSREDIPDGVNKPQQVVLEKDGTRLHAIFRVVDKKQKDVRIGERFYFDFRDSHRHEPAAYELARWLGLDCVPPALPRQLDGKDGSFQIWVEKALKSDQLDSRPPDIQAWVRQGWDRDLFDNLILNVDRNQGNILVGQQYRVWLIDHTRGFQPERQLLSPETLARVKRSVWDRLVAMTEEDLKGLVGDYLDNSQVNSLAKRRELLIEHVEGLVAERGEGAVFY